MLAGTALSVLLWLGAGWLVDRVTVYPGSRRVSGPDLRLVFDCPAYGYRIGSVRSPLCRLEVSRTALYESEASISDVRRWQAGRERAWHVTFGRLALRANLARFGPAPPANAHTRFSLAAGLYLEVLADQNVSRRVRKAGPIRSGEPAGI